MVDAVLLDAVNSWCPWSGLNARPLPYQGSALPLSYMGRKTESQAFAKIESDPSFLTTSHAVRVLHIQNRSLGAGEGNRTLVVSLEGFCSTIELHPRVRRQRLGDIGQTVRVQLPCSCHAVAIYTQQTRIVPCLLFADSRMVEGEGFEPSKAEPTDLQSVPFDRSGTPPAKHARIAISVPGVKRFVFHRDKVHFTTGNAR